MRKTEYEKELSKQPYSTLVFTCEGKGLLHTGNKDALIARLVEWEKSQNPEPGPELEPPAPGSEPKAEAEAAKAEAEAEARAEAEAKAEAEAAKVEAKEE